MLQNKTISTFVRRIYLFAVFAMRFCSGFSQTPDLSFIKKISSSIYQRACGLKPARDILSRHTSEMAKIVPWRFLYILTAILTSFDECKIDQIIQNNSHNYTCHSLSKAKVPGHNQGQQLAHGSVPYILRAGVLSFNVWLFHVIDGVLLMCVGMVCEFRLCVLEQWMEFWATERKFNLHDTSFEYCRLHGIGVMK